MSLQPEPTANDPLGHDPRQWVSAAADGDADAMARACRAWRDDGQARSHWHTYHLIGDVMRSSELAAEPGRDAAFLAALRQKLAAEPVVLAPQPLPAARRAGAAWLVPAAVAAGFVVVAGVLVVSRMSAPVDQGAPLLASASSPGGAVARVSGTAPLSTAAQSDSTVIRDARLDEYLRAHQSARGGIAVPGGGLRRVDAELPAGASR